MRSFTQRLLVTALPFSLIGVSSGQASEVDLPGTMAWTAYDTNSSGYAQAVAIGTNTAPRCACCL